MMKVQVFLFLQFVYLSGLVSSTPSKSYHLYKKVTPHTDVSISNNDPLTFQEFSQWKLWKATHSREYGTPLAEIHRLSIWLSNRRYVEKHNEQAHQHGFKLKINSFGDLVSTFHSHYWHSSIIYFYLIVIERMDKELQLSQDRFLQRGLRGGLGESVWTSGRLG